MAHQKLSELSDEQLNKKYGNLAQKAKVHVTRDGGLHLDREFKHPLIMYYIDLLREEPEFFAQKHSEKSDNS